MKAFSLIRLTANMIADNKILLAPLLLLLFFYLAALEVMYFIPYEPLINYLGLIVQKLFGDLFLHYPHHLALLPKLFQHCQLIIYVLFGSLLIPVTIELVQQLYRQQQVSVKRAFGAAVVLYPYVFVLFSVMITILIWKMGLMDLVVQRATRIRSTSGTFMFLKSAVIYGAPYLNFVAEILIQSVFVATVPAIVIGRRKLSSALKVNFQILKHYWSTVITLILIPSLMHIPIQFLRGTSVYTDVLPETTVILLAAGACVNVLVDAFVFVGLTLLCLIPKDHA